VIDFESYQPETTAGSSEVFRPKSDWPVSGIDVESLSRDELVDVLERVMIRLRQFDAEQIKREYVTKSQKQWLKTTKRQVALQG